MALRFAQDITFGCNIGALFVKSGKVIPPTEALENHKNNELDDCFRFTPKGDQTKIGVMVSTCRAVTGDEIHYAFENIRKVAKNKGAKVFLEPAGGITPSASLTLRFAYEEERPGNTTLAALRKPDVMVPLLDILLGNTSVLIGGGIPKNKLDRQWRKEKFGITYCLPNFWYKSYPLASFAMGLGRLAVNIAAQDCAKLLIEAVDLNDIKKAIKENNVELAYANFRKIEKVLLELTGTNDENYPLTARNIADFHFFIEKGINHWFKRWSFASVYSGWENFLASRVRRQRRLVPQGGGLIK